MNSYHQVGVQCPFYRGDDGSGRIVCEGLIDTPGDVCSRIALEYDRKADFKAQIKGICSGRYVGCEIYRVLIEKEEYE